MTLASKLADSLRQPRTILIMDQAAIDADRPGWLKRRTDGITGTDVATLLGLSAHMRPYGLYHAKIDGTESHDKPVMRRGRKLEPEIDDLLRDDFPQFQPAPAGLYAAGDPVRRWMMATLDRWLIDTEAASGAARQIWADFPDGRPGLEVVEPGEYKTWATKDGWRDPGRGVIGDGNVPGAMPVSVRCQAIWNMTVAGKPSILVVVLFMTSWQVGVYRITADDPGIRNDLALMISSADRFRVRLASRDEPDVDDHPSTTETLRQLHPSLVDGEVRVPGRWWLAYHDGRNAKLRAEARVKLVQNRLRQRMGNVARAYVVLTPDGKLRRGRERRDDRRVIVCSRSIGDTKVRAHDRHDDKLNPGKVQP